MFYIFLFKLSAFTWKSLQLCIKSPIIIQTKSYDPVIYKTPTGNKLSCKGRIQEAALRMLLSRPWFTKDRYFWWSNQHKIIQSNIIFLYLLFLMSLSTRNLLGIKDLTVDDIFLILKTAEQFKEVLQRPVKKVPSLPDVTIVNLFYDNSTRTIFFHTPK